MRVQGGHGTLVSEGRLAECLELLAEEQERGRRLLALMHAHDQAAADRTEALMLKARHSAYVVTSSKLRRSGIGTWSRVGAK